MLRVRRDRAGSAVAMVLLVMGGLASGCREQRDEPCDFHGSSLPQHVDPDPIAFGSYMQAAAIVKVVEYVGRVDHDADCAEIFVVEPVDYIEPVRLPGHNVVAPHKLVAVRVSSRHTPRYFHPDDVGSTGLLFFNRWTDEMAESARHHPVYVAAAEEARQRSKEGSPAVIVTVADFYPRTGDESTGRWSGETWVWDELVKQVREARETFWSGADTSKAPTPPP